MKLVHDSALKVERLSSNKGESRYRLAGRHCATDICGRMALYRFTILGWPVGTFCMPCHRKLVAAWDSCFEEEEAKVAA